MNSASIIPICFFHQLSLSKLFSQSIWKALRFFYCIKFSDFLEFYNAIEFRKFNWFSNYYSVKF